MIFTCQIHLQAKSRIHTVMSRQLETLRSREVWLLQQVDLLADTKDSVLWHQAEELHAALAALQACVACLEAGDSADLDVKIKETLERLVESNIPLQDLFYYVPLGNSRIGE